MGAAEEEDDLALGGRGAEWAGVGGGGGRVVSNESETGLAGVEVGGESGEEEEMALDRRVYNVEAGVGTGERTRRSAGLGVLVTLLILDLISTEDERREEGVRRDREGGVGGQDTK